MELEYNQYERDNVVLYKLNYTALFYFLSFSTYSAKVRKGIEGYDREIIETNGF